MGAASGPRAIRCARAQQCRTLGTLASDSRTRTLDIPSILIVGGVALICTCSAALHFLLSPWTPFSLCCLAPGVTHLDSSLSLRVDKPDGVFENTFVNVGVLRGVGWHLEIYSSSSMGQLVGRMLPLFVLG